MEQVLVRNKSVTWGGRRTAVLLMLLALLLPLLVLAPAPPPVDMDKVQPALRALVVEQPEAVVKVIVQKQVTGDAVEQQVAALGGAVTKDLHIINAFAAEVPAAALADLAANAAVRWISLDGPVESQAKGGGGKGGGGTADPINVYLDTLGVRQVWDMGYRGEGVAIAIIDSGIGSSRDFYLDPNANGNHLEYRIRQRLSMDPSVSNNDGTGHGTHVAGIVAGNGDQSDGAYAGIAPMADLISISVSNGQGMAYESDTVEAMQWVLDNKDAYNIRIVNLSLNSTVEQTYHESAMDAAAEILWFNGVVVVASSGNKGPGGGYNTVNAAPANDPFVITVGASDERGTADASDDNWASFSAHGTTMDGQLKPDIIAPGKDIVSVLAANSSWKSDYPDRVTSNGKYFRASGTSMAAPMVSGATALLLQAEPNLTPDQVKYRLMTASRTIPGEMGDIEGYPYAYLDIYAALTTPTTASANTGLVASQLLWTGSEPITWTSVNWNSVNWNSVNWNSVNWNSVNWNSVNWNSVSWNS